MVIDRRGHHIGVLADVYLDDRGDEPWGAISTAKSDPMLRMAPLGGASPRGAQLRVDASRPRIMTAPRVTPGGQMDVATERRLFEHYQRKYQTAKPRDAA